MPEVGYPRGADQTNRIWDEPHLEGDPRQEPGVSNANAENAKSAWGKIPMISTKPQLEPEPAEVMQRAKRANAEAFYQLVRPCERAIFQAALAILGNVTDAEDVAQEAVLKAFKHISSFRGESKFSTWLIQITINEARMKLRKDRPGLYYSLDESTSAEDGEYLPKELADWREIPSTALENRELRETLTRALISLSPKYRSVFVLRDVQGLNIAETARLLGISEVCVKTRLCRARLQMREALAPGLRPGWDLGSPPVTSGQNRYSATI
jgi:RNA polymerase sigma-70 factor (ECF subfamily)